MSNINVIQKKRDSRTTTSIDNKTAWKDYGATRDSYFNILYDNNRFCIGMFTYKFSFL